MGKAKYYHAKSIYFMNANLAKPLQTVPSGNVVKTTCSKLYTKTY